VNFEAVRKYFKPLTDDEVRALAREHADNPGVEQSVYLEEVGLQELAMADSQQTRPVPELTPGQIAFHGRLTASRETFSLAAVTARSAKREGPKIWLLPQNPGPFGTLAEWTAWRDWLITMGTENQGVDVELEVANKLIAELQAETKK
jgi:hypothetical protein